MSVWVMKLRLDCVVCIARQALKAARLASQDIRIHEAVLREVLKRLSKVEWVGTPPHLVRRVNAAEIIEALTGVSDPYKDLKMKSNEEALSLLNYVKELISTADDRLRAAVKVAIAGNIIDFAAVEKYDLKETINKVLHQEPRIDDYQELREAVEEANTVLYFADNAGEIVFDKVLLEEMISFRGKPFNKITFVVKGAPIINDATLEDALHVGLDKIPNISFSTVAGGRKGSGPERSSEEVLSWIENHDLIISKGQGNYEDLSEFKNIFFLLMVKCPVVAEDIGAEVGDIVIMHSK
jgi:uncharacterized protein with ATP-grasp and redox domains